MSVLFVGCIGRLAALQLMPAGFLSSMRASSGKGEGLEVYAVKQRKRSLILDTGRGDFYDRYGKPITGETYMSIAMYPVKETAPDYEEKLDRLAVLLGIGLDELKGELARLKEAAFWKRKGELLPVRLSREQAAAVEDLKVDGIYVLPYRNRYLTSFPAKHVIGFTSEHPELLMREHGQEVRSGKRRLNEQVGAAGLERSLDAVLRGIGETTADLYANGRGQVLQGLAIRTRGMPSAYYPLQIVTTIDLELQNAIEKYVDQEQLVEGSVVVLDASNADIVAMVSRPKLQIGRFRSGDGSEWVNHALRAVEPGSIFKLVTEAAALEYRAAHLKEVFVCDGVYERYGLSCWKEGGHGVLTLEEGLAQSCNIVFAEVAERLQAAQLLSVAEALGIGRQAGWYSERGVGPFRWPLRLLPEEEAGRLFARGEAGREAMLAAADGGVRAQSGIGQRDVRMSPLQAANLIVTLLSGGRAWEPRVVSEIRYADGKRMAVLPAQRAQWQDGRRMIRPSTAAALLRGMAAVVDHGTGRSIRQGAWAVAGKSGTAETMRAGEVRNHQWFAGYGPVNAPRYAVVVLAANRSPGSPHQATKLFRGVMDIAAAAKSPAAHQ